MHFEKWNFARDVYDCIHFACESCECRDGNWFVIQWQSIPNIFPFKRSGNLCLVTH